MNHHRYRARVGGRVQRLTLSAWLRVPEVAALGLDRQQILQRITRHGWSPQRALTTPLIDSHAPREVEGVLVDARTPYAEDVACQLIVSSHPDGATLDLIGEAMGITRERVRQIEDLAQARLRARAKVAGIDVDDLLALAAGQR